jgi:hypothetical protein
VIEVASGGVVGATGGVVGAGGSPLTSLRSMWMGGAAERRSLSMIREGG